VEDNLVAEGPDRHCHVAICEQKQSDKEGLVRFEEVQVNQDEGVAIVAKISHVVMFFL
jgi:hypothetical protein